MECIENLTFDEIKVGDSECLTRTLTSQDLYLFAAVLGDVNPTHVDEHYARHFLSGRLVGHSLWSGALISGLLGTQLPGPGTVYESQDLRFLRPVQVGDTVTATVTAREQAPRWPSGRLRLSLRQPARRGRGHRRRGGPRPDRAPPAAPAGAPGGGGSGAQQVRVLFSDRCKGLPPARPGLHAARRIPSAAAEAAEAGLIEPLPAPVHRPGRRPPRLRHRQVPGSGGPRRPPGRRQGVSSWSARARPRC